MEQTKHKKPNTERLTVSAILIALASVLSLFTPLALPQGGGITIMSMLPIILISYRYGLKWGTAAAFIYSVIQLLFGFSTVSAFFMPGDSQEIWWRAILICLLDYIVAYTSMTLGGIFRKKMAAPVALCFGVVVALTVRYIVHIISGAIFFGVWAEWWFTDVMAGDFGASVLEKYSGFSLALFYSVFYNGLYMIPEIIITAIGGYVVGKIPVLKEMKD